MADDFNRRDAILRVAQALIVAGGYNAFSYADISKIVGIRNASIHHHFPTKADLVRELVMQYRQKVVAGLAELERGVPRPADRLRAYAGYWEACVADRTLPFCVCALLSTELPVLPDAVAAEVRAHFHSLREWIAGVLARGAEAGQVRLDQPAEAEADLFMATIHGALMSARAFGDPKLFATIVRPAVARLMSD